MQAGRALTLAPLSAPERDARPKGEAPSGAERLLSRAEGAGVRFPVAQLSLRAASALISTWAKLMPMQMRGPPPNVTRPYGVALSSSRGLAKRSGSHRSGCAKTVGRRWLAATEYITRVPAGIV